MPGIRLDGKGQYLAKFDGVARLAVSNTWTLAFWVKPGAFNEFATIFSVEGEGKNEIQVFTTAIPAETGELGKRPAELRALIKDADGTTIKHYGWKNHFYVDTWVHTALVWDGTDLEAYTNGVLAVTGTVGFVTGTGVMSDYPTRKVFYGSLASGRAATFSGIIGHFGIWNSALENAELLTVYSGGFDIDLTTTSGDYISSGNLQHYWKPGEDPADLGKDYTTTASGINIGDNARNVTSDNITPESP